MTIRGESREYERFGEEGGQWVREYFCTGCGVRIFYRVEQRPEMISIPLGAFATADFPPPTAEVFGEKATAWLGRQLGEAAQE